MMVCNINLLLKQVWKWAHRRKKTKHAYYWVVYSAISLVQGVFLYEKRKRHSTDWKEESNASHTWTSRAQVGLPKARGTTADLVAPAILGQSWPVTLTPGCSFCLTLCISLRLAKVSELGWDFWLVGLEQSILLKKQTESIAILRWKHRRAILSQREKFLPSQDALRVFLHRALKCSSTFKQETHSSLLATTTHLKTKQRHSSSQGTGNLEQCLSSFEW